VKQLKRRKTEEGETSGKNVKLYSFLKPFSSGNID